MNPGKVIVGIAAVLSLHTDATAAMYVIKNPAEKIINPADKIFNPATQVNNPAANIYNPATRMNNQDPLSPPVQPVPQPVAAQPAVKPQIQSKDQLPPRQSIPQKSYNFKTVKAYITQAKKAFIRDDYIEFLSITEDALRRIQAGSLKASNKSRQKLEKYKTFGYAFLENNED